MPGEILEPQTTALVLIDLEKAIVERELAPHSGKDVVERCARLADALRAKGGLVVYVHVLLDQMHQRPVDRPMASRGTPPPESSEIVPEAGLQAGDVVVTKRQWGAFYATNMEQALRRRGIETIIMGGIATNLGVESTARVAFDMDYSLVFAEDAMSTQDEAMHRFAVETIFPLMGRVRSTEQIIKAISP